MAGWIWLSKKFIIGVKNWAYELVSATKIKYSTYLDIESLLIWGVSFSSGDPDISRKCSACLSNEKLCAQPRLPYQGTNSNIWGGTFRGARATCKLLLSKTLPQEISSRIRSRRTRCEHACQGRCISASTAVPQLLIFRAAHSAAMTRPAPQHLFWNLNATMAASRSAISSICVSRGWWFADILRQQCQQFLHRQFRAACSSSRPTIQHNKAGWPNLSCYGKFQIDVHPVLQFEFYFTSLSKRSANTTPKNKQQVRCTMDKASNETKYKSNCRVTNEYFGANSVW